ncbi:MAG: LapA family protein [Alphaproteobacteria bacterium]|nr:LapA family protein [Alphaproteobacteria bacterium]
MVAFFRTILGLIVTIPIAAFCGLNLQVVDVTYSPFHDPIQLPLYAIGLVFALFGVLFGAFSVWLNNSPLRKELRLFKKRVRTLKKELKRWQEQKGGVDSAVSAIVEKEVSSLPVSQNE